MSWLCSAVLLAAALCYVVAAMVVHRRGRWWPPERTACWIAGLVVAGAAVVGPLAGAAHHDFTARMAGHLLLGMAAPLLLVLAAPVTLALRAMPVAHARTVSHLLARPPVRAVTHPVTAAILDGAGLWVVYTTALYRVMSEHPWLQVAVHAHVVTVGYLFTAGIVGVDPAPHRPRPPTRAIGLITFLAAHDILAKYLYGHPPPGLYAGETRAGAELMYYGGDLIDLVLIFVFCRHWYRAADPRRRTKVTTPRIPHARPPRAAWRLPDELRSVGEATTAR